MGWCVLGTLLRWLTCPRVWRLYCRWIPVGQYGTTPLTLMAIDVYCYIQEREIAWWNAGPRRRKFYEMAQGSSNADDLPGGKR